MQKLGGGYEGKPSIFDEMTPDDLIMSFFPCTRFEAQILLKFRGEQYQDINKSDEFKLNTDLQLHEELHENYELITKLALICIKKNLKMVFENPYSEQHYLTRYWCLKPAIIDRDRTLDGDYFKKPTQYWFINCEPKQNIIFEPIEWVPRARVAGGGIKGIGQTTGRSMIHPQYANRFIRKYLIDWRQE